VKKLNWLLTFVLLLGSALAFASPIEAKPKVRHAAYVVKHGKRYYRASNGRYYAKVSSQTSPRNTGINSVLSPNLSCGPDERNNHVTKGAAYGAGAGLLTGGGLIGGVVGAGAGALVQQEQNRDACRGRRSR
jgi:hypothetical protein